MSESEYTLGDVRGMRSASSSGGWGNGLAWIALAALTSACADDASEVSCAAAFPEPADATMAAAETWFVAPGGTGDGRSCAAPLGTIQGALDGAKGVAVIRIAPGTYAETLAAARNVTLLAATSASEEAVWSPNDGVESAGVIIKVPAPDAWSVIIKRPSDSAGEAGVIIKSPAPALVVTGGEVTLMGIAIEEPAIAGVHVRGGTLTLDTCRIIGASPKAGTAREGTSIGGVGAWADPGTRLTITRSRIEGNDVGVQWVQAVGTLDASLVAENPAGGIVSVDASAAIILQDSAIIGNGTYGVGLFGGTGIILQRNAIAGTTGSDAAAGDGLFIGPNSKGAAAEVERIEGNVFQDNARLGVMLQAARGVIIKNEVLGNRRGGLWLQEASGGDADADAITVEDNTFRENRYVAVAVAKGARGIILQNTIDDTRAGEVLGGTVGDGIGLYSGATARIAGNTVTGAARAGVLLDDAAGGSATTVTGNVVTGGRGIILQRPRAEAVAIADNEAEVETLSEPLPLMPEATTGFAAPTALAE